MWVNAETLVVRKSVLSQVPKWQNERIDNFWKIVDVHNFIWYLEQIHLFYYFRYPCFGVVQDWLKLIFWNEDSDPYPNSNHGQN